ncbi:MAG TPA: MmcQ/YjbR family DNA-binding protein [Streptosporangiaceae bacterium]|jgi:predicted DNA-binding protein (MmcQ/YjbR family)
MSQVDEVIRCCGAMPGSVEYYPFGEQPAVYKVGGKMFALLSMDANPPQIAVKLPPEEGLALRAQYPERVLPGYHLNKRHWNTVVLDETLDDAEVLSLVQQSYDLIVTALPRRLRPDQADR